MKVLVVHNEYLVKGGEDTVFKNETEALKNKGIDITYLVKNNEKIGFIKKVLLFFTSVFSFGSFIDMIRTINNDKPDVIHVHNFFPKLSPSIFWAASVKKIPVVMTLHNYRIICPSATFFVGDDINVKSITDGPWWTLTKRVYKDSLFGTMSLCLMISVNKQINTWGRVSKFICLTNFSKEVFVKFGLSSRQISIKPNLYHIEKSDINKDSDFNIDLPERFVLFVGRLTKDKGIDIILDSLRENNYLTVVVGEGPFAHNLKDRDNLLFLGKCSSSLVAYLMMRATALLVPSLWFEGLPMVIVEAYANRLPVIASDIGSLSEIVIDDVTGIHLKVGDVESLSISINKICSDLSYRMRLSEGAYSYFSDNFEEDKNIEMLVSIYKEVINESKY